MMRRFELVMLQEWPDAILAVGDVNSTIACSLVISKLSYPTPLAGVGRHRALLVHVEAWLRSGEWGLADAGGSKPRVDRRTE